MRFTRHARLSKPRGLTMTVSLLCHMYPPHNVVCLCHVCALLLQFGGLFRASSTGLIFALGLYQLATLLAAHVRI